MHLLLGVRDDYGDTFTIQRVGDVEEGEESTDRVW